MDGAGADVGCAVSDIEEYGHLVTARVFGLVEPHLRAAIWQALAELSARGIAPPAPSTPGLGRNQSAALDAFEVLMQRATERGVDYVFEADWRNASKLPRQRWPEARRTLIDKGLVVCRGRGAYSRPLP